METIRVEKTFPAGMWRLSGLHEPRLYMGYTLREAKRLYRLEYRQLRLGDKPAEFYTLTGDLTPYALACGYVQTYGEWKLYKDGVFHLQNGAEWLTFARLGDARKAARKLSKGTKK